MTGIGEVDRALNRYVRSMRGRGVNPEGFRAKTLAGLIGVPVESMSTWLQEYRLAQRDGTTRYVIACHQYGRAARWRIVRQPGGVDDASTQTFRIVQAMHVCRDACKRAVMDFACEVAPAAVFATPDDMRIGTVQTMVEQQLDVLLHAVETLLTMSTP